MKMEYMLADIWYLKYFQSMQSTFLVLLKPIVNTECMKLRVMDFGARTSFRHLKLYLYYA